MHKDQFQPKAPIRPTAHLNRIGQGRHFLQIPGPSNVPDRILRAIDFPTIDHRGPEFQRLGLQILEQIRPVFGTSNPVIIYPASGTGAWEAALVNTLSPGDRVIMAETGHFASLWKKLAEKMGLRPEFIPGNWRRGVDANAIEDLLRSDTSGEIKAVCVVHNETSTGVTSNIESVRKAIDAAKRSAKSSSACFCCSINAGRTKLLLMYPSRLPSIHDFARPGYCKLFRVGIIASPSCAITGMVSLPFGLPPL